MERHITIGIAGHVDHGKTSLVKALTGIDTDRGKEEKERGLSIEAGIALFLNHLGLSISFVDVPGHVDFLKNTIRGLSCVDGAILVVAADEGIRPQTKDHLRLLEFFGIKKGLVVLTKIDLVDGELLEIARLEAEELMKGTSLEGSPIIPVSTKEGIGLTDLRTEIIKMARSSPLKDLHGPFRLWVDNVRTVPGIGVVISGTVFSGILARNETVILLPQGIEAKVRSLQSHHVSVERVLAGQRAGIALSRISEKEVSRGMLLCKPGELEVYPYLNVEISIPKDLHNPITNRQKVRCYIGTSMNKCIVVLPNETPLQPGQTGLAQLRFINPVCALPLDPVVLTPLNHPGILGGGKVMELTREKLRPTKAKRFISRLEAIREGKVETYVEEVLKSSNRILNPQQISKTTALASATIERELERLLRHGRALHFTAKGYFSSERLQDMCEKAMDLINEAFNQNPFKDFVALDELKSKLMGSLDDELFQAIIKKLRDDKKIYVSDGHINRMHISSQIPKGKQEIINQILEYAKQSAFVPFSADTFWKAYNQIHNKNQVQVLLEYLYRRGILVRFKNKRYMLASLINEIMERIKEVISEKGFLALEDCRRVLGYGRTVCVWVFEYLDSIGFTKRVGMIRVLNDDAMYRNEPIILGDENAK